MIGSTKTPGASTLTAFVAVVVLGGCNFLAVRVSNGELPPFWGAGLRFSLAATVFVVVAWSMRLTWPRGRQLALIATYGLFNITLSYALMYWALVRVTAGMTVVILAMVPLITSLLAVAQRLEPLNRRMVLGAVLALGGILWMALGPDGLVLPLGGLVAVIAAALALGEGVILGKRVSSSHPVMTNAVGMSVGSPLLLVMSLIVGENWVLPSEPDTMLAITYLVLLGSVSLFVLVLLVIRRWTASITSYVFVLFPVVTMLVEAWLFDEPLTFRGVTGALVVMAAVWFGALSRPGHDESQRSPTLPLNEYSAGPTIQATPSRKSTEA